jgi:hypothetical protein
MNGNVHTANVFAAHYYYMYSDSACTNQISKANIYGIVNVVDVSNGFPYSGEGLFGG